MVVLHYAGISENKSSGVSVIVPEIVNAQSRILIMDKVRLLLKMR